MQVTNTGLVSVSFPPLLQWRESEQTHGSSIESHLTCPNIDRTAVV